VPSSSFLWELWKCFSLVIPIHRWKHHDVKAHTNAGHGSTLLTWDWSDQQHSYLFTSLDDQGLNHSVPDLHQCPVRKFSGVPQEPIHKLKLTEPTREKMTKPVCRLQFADFWGIGRNIWVHCHVANVQGLCTATYGSWLYLLQLHSSQQQGPQYMTGTHLLNEPNCLQTDIEDQLQEQPTTNKRLKVSLCIKLVTLIALFPVQKLVPSWTHSESRLAN
jgi:hypothetical protein